MELNTPSRRSQIIKALHNPASRWRKTVQGYAIDLSRRDDSSIEWSVVVKKPTRKDRSLVIVANVSTTVFDALVAIENAIEGRLLRN